MSGAASIRKEWGFTLIELVVVIVLLGILAAIALPKFVDLSGQARTAANRGFSGGLATAVSQSHGLWMAQSNPSTVTLQDGTVVHMNSTGWPDGIGSATQGTDAGCANVWNNMLQNPTQAIATTCGAVTTPCYAAAYASAGTCTYTLNSTNGSTTYTVVYNYTTGAVTPSP